MVGMGSAATGKGFDGDLGLLESDTGALAVDLDGLDQVAGRDRLQESGSVAGV